MGTDLKREIPVIFVQMDEDNGISISTSKQAVIPFTMIESLAKLNHGGVKYIRYQLPLIPAHCQTIHSSQGLTAMSDLVIEPSPSTPFEMALEYGCRNFTSHKIVPFAHIIAVQTNTFQLQKFISTMDI